MGLRQRKNRLGMYRRIRGYTQAELSKRIGVTRVTIANWELDVTHPTQEQAEAISRLLRVSVRELFPYHAY
jgi:DNA-binding XRE family transcriptional regulator